MRQIIKRRALHRSEGFVEAHFHVEGRNSLILQGEHALHSFQPHGSLILLLRMSSFTHTARFSDLLVAHDANIQLLTEEL